MLNTTPRIRLLCWRLFTLHRATTIPPFAHILQGPISHLAAAASTLSPADAEDASVAAIYQLLLPQADAGLPQADA